MNTDKKGKRDKQAWVKTESSDETGRRVSVCVSEGPSLRCASISV